MNRKKKLRLELRHFYPVAKYAGAAFAALACPHLHETTWIWGSVFSSRLLILLWTPILLLFGLWLDRSRAQAASKDDAERRAGIKYGGLNESTLLALSVPLMFILDALAIIHVFLSYFRSGTAASVSPAASLLPAAGMVLFIYGRALPHIRYGSIWGITTKAARKDEESWQRIHRFAAIPVTLLGALALVLSAFLTGTAAIVACIVLCAAAFAVMFLPQSP